MPALIRKLPNLREIQREMPYIRKARALIYAHLSRVPLPQQTLEQDRRYIAKKCPLLVGEMVSMVSQMCMARILYNIPARSLPNLKTLEDVMLLHAMIVQVIFFNYPSHCLCNNLIFFSGRLGQQKQFDAVATFH